MEFHQSLRFPACQAAPFNIWPHNHTTIETTIQSFVFIKIILIQEKSALLNQLWCLQKLKTKITELYNPIKAF